MPWVTWAAALTALAVVTIGISKAHGQVDLPTNFLGAARQDTGGEVRPDSMGAVGPDHIVLMINGRYRVWDKEVIPDPDTNEAAPLPGHDGDLKRFWVEAGANAVQGLVGDPRVVFDPYEERFFAVSLLRDGTTTSDFLVAVSNSARFDTLQSINDLHLNWTAFNVDSDTDNLQALDFPMLGVNRDAIIVGGHMRPYNENRDDPEVNVLAIPKSSLVAASASTDDYHLFEDKVAVTGQIPHPVMHLDNNPMPAPLLTGAHNSVRRTDVFAIGTNGFTGDTGHPSATDGDITLDNHDDAPNGVQPGNAPDLFNMNGPDNIEFSPAVLTSYAVYQDGFIWGVHGREGPDHGQASVRWFKIDPSRNTRVAEGVIEGIATYAASDVNENNPAYADLLYPSIAVNKQGDVVIGFTATSEYLSPSSYAVVGHRDGNGAKFGELQLLKGGMGTYDVVTTNTGGNSTWGDYSATVVDPVNPLRFWTFQEFLIDDDQWGVQITELKLRDNTDGDMDFDGDVDLDDVKPFVLALNDPEAYYSTIGAPVCLHGDLDDDGDELDLDDIDDFVALLNTGSGGGVATCDPVEVELGVVPEPESFTLVLIAAMIYCGASARRMLWPFTNVPRQMDR